MENLLSLPFARVREVQESPRYHCDNRQRGTDRFVILQATLRGEGRFEIEGQAHRVPLGHALIALVPEASRYFYPQEGGEPWIFSWINFYGELSLRLWRELRDEAGPVVPLAPPAMRILQRLTARTATGKWADPYEASGEAYRFYLETLRHLPKRKPAEPFENVVRYFRAHYQTGIRMKEVAAHAGMSREHFTRLFAKAMGKAPAAYLREMRLEAAARLLGSTDVPIGEVAFRSGWASATKLDFFFKRHYGVSPKAYRAKTSKKIPSF